MLELLAMTPWLVGASAALGLVVGSFLNVVIHRLPREQSLLWPGSRCPVCERVLGPLENVPVLSYLIQRGRCRGCGTAISPRYPLIEALTGVLFVLVALRFGPTPWAPLGMAFAASLVAAAAIDAEHRIIPDSISVGGLVVGLVAVPALRVWDGSPPAAAIQHSAVGALLGGGLLWVVGFAHARLSTALGRTFEHWPGDGAAHPRPASLDYWTWFPGLGFGDVKLLAMIGAFLGPFGVMETILAGSVLGLAFGVARGLVLRRMDTPFGFGPALVAGALFVLLSPWRLLPGL